MLKATQYTHDTGLYTGRFNDLGQMEGKGVLYKCEEPWVGKFKIYDGEFKNNLPNGLGKTYHHETGYLVYEGEHKDGYPHGSGTFYYEDGSRGEGPVINGYLHGEGAKLYTLNGKLYYEGGIKHPVGKHGHGT